MVFSSVIFLFYFLPATLGGYFIVKKELRNAVLLLASLFFYAWGEPKFIVVLILSIFINYLAGIGIHTFRESGKAKWIMAVGVFANLSILFFYKYIDFTITILNHISVKIIPGYREIGPLGIALPIGLSFFTFQGLSYVIDVYKNTVPVQKNPLHIALYISMFPQLVAGPIVRYIDIAPEIVSRKTKLEDLSIGFQRFIIGLSKKVMIADILASVSDQIFSSPLEQLTTSVAWMGIVCYTFQIFFDFSGYSDMAIGLGRIFGFRFIENFNLPYISCSVSEFWRRWHISLSTWFRDYLYIPMGGNRKGNVYIHLLVVFFCTGLWHGAALTFIVWGLWHGMFLVLERVGRLKGYTAPFPRCVRWGYTAFVVIIGWVLFRSSDLAYAAGFLRTMCGICSPDFKFFSLAYYLDNQIIFTLAAALIVSVGIPGKIMSCLQKKKWEHMWEHIKMFVYWFLLLCCIAMIVNGNYSPFIYFRF